MNNNINEIKKSLFECLTVVNTIVDNHNNTDQSDLNLMNYVQFHKDFQKLYINLNKANRINSDLSNRNIENSINSINTDAKEAIEPYSQYKEF